MRFIVQVGGIRAVDAQLARFSGRVRDMRPAFDQMLDTFADTERSRFASEGRTGGGGGQRWAPLSPKYRSWKAKNYPGRPILVRTGALRKSLTERPLGIEQITRHSLTFGSDVTYGAHHQLGTRRMPARKPVALTATAQRRMAKQLQVFILHGEL